MNNPFFEQPILNSPYEYPNRHWELDATGQPTQRTMDRRRDASFITPIPKPKKRKQQAEQTQLFENDLSTKEQKYEHTALINPYNPPGPTVHVNLTTSKTDRYETESRRCQPNRVILDSDWEAEFTEVSRIESDFEKKVSSHYDDMMDRATSGRN